MLTVPSIETCFHATDALLCRAEKRQRVIDILLQIMVDSIGFTVSINWQITDLADDRESVVHDVRSWLMITEYYCQYLTI